MTNLFTLDLHPIEVTLAALSFVAIVMWSWLLVLKHLDVIHNASNGPIQFMLNDNRILGILGTVASFMAGSVAFVALLERPDKYDYRWMEQSYYSMLIINGFALFLIVLAFFRFRRRIKMAELVAKYDLGLTAMELVNPLEGGSRPYDPPNSVSECQSPTKK